MKTRSDKVNYDNTNHTPTRTIRKPRKPRKPSVNNNSLKKIYYDINDPDSFGSSEKLRKRTKISKKDVNKWLANELAYSLNKPIKRKFPTRSYKVSAPNHLWQIDLMEMIPYANINNGYKYIMNVIDVFSRYVWALPLKTKSGTEVAQALKSILEKQSPHNIQTDLGKEFYNMHVDKVFKEKKINHYTVHSQFKAAMIERFNRTLRGKLAKYFTHKGKKTWYNVLKEVIQSYNNTIHNSLNSYTPSQMYNTKDLGIWLSQNTNIKPNKKPSFKVNDYVRISRISISPFIKNFDNNWSDEVFQIADIDTNDNPIMYILKDIDGNTLKGKFYTQELQLLPKIPQIFRIEQILETQGEGKHKQHLVKWVGYRNPTWIKANQIST